MDDGALVDALLHAAEKLGVPVRVEPFDPPAVGPGGLCRLHGTLLIVLDARAPLPARLQALVQALAGLDSDRIYLVPEARELVEAARRDSELARGRGERAPASAGSSHAPGDSPAPPSAGAPDRGHP